jgi:hypothetical protein
MKFKLQYSTNDGSQYVIKRVEIENGAIVSVRGLAKTFKPAWAELCIVTITPMPKTEVIHF